jgi:hypothetical protein
VTATTIAPRRARTLALAAVALALAMAGITRLIAAFARAAFA